MELQRKARLATAKIAMEKAWAAAGGPKSKVGLPRNGQVEVREVTQSGETNGALIGYVADFRGGSITLSPDGTRSATKTETLVSIMLVGLECEVRQEATDEMYGLVSILGPSDSTVVSKRFPDSGTLNMGPDGIRINDMAVMLIDGGVIQNYQIMGCLFEHDSGDVDVIAKDVSDKVASTAAEALGGLTGAPAEAVGDSESFKQNLASGLAWVFGNVLGMGDDPYDPQSISLPWSTLVSGAVSVQPPIHRNDDSRTIEDWTHKIVLSGVDDGGDRGQYVLYFRVWTTQDVQTTTS